MSEEEHIDYFQKRADTERELARAAPADYVSRIHLDMAELYDALVQRPDCRDELKIVADPWGPETK